MAEYDVVTVVIEDLTAFTVTESAAEAFSVVGDVNEPSVADVEQVTVVALVEEAVETATIVESDGPGSVDVHEYGASFAAADRLIVSRRAALDLHGGQCVASDESGAWTVASPGTVQGILLGAATAGRTADAVTQGPVTDPAFSWAPSLPVFCAPDGTMTQTIPSSGALQIVGRPVGPHAVLVAIQPPIIAI